MFRFLAYNTIQNNTTVFNTSNMYSKVVSQKVKLLKCIGVQAQLYM